MNVKFQYDVFISYSNKDFVVVEGIAKRLKENMLNVWYDKWVLKPGDVIQSKIEYGLENSRILLLCMSENAYGSDWVAIENQTFRFRDPLNSERRFIPIRLDDSPIKGTLNQFVYIDWRKTEEHEFDRLLEACGGNKKKKEAFNLKVSNNSPSRIITFNHRDNVNCVDWNLKDSLMASGSSDNSISLWDTRSGKQINKLKGHLQAVWCIAFNPNGNYILSGSSDTSVRLWNVSTGKCEQIFKGHQNTVWNVKWSFDGRYAISCSSDKTARVWKIIDGDGKKPIVENSTIWCTAWHPKEMVVLLGLESKEIHVWDINNGICVNRLEGHTGPVRCVLWCLDGKLIVSGAADNTVRLWDGKTGRCLRVLEGHTGIIRSIALSRRGKYILSGSSDRTVRVWEIESGKCICVLGMHPERVWDVAWGSENDTFYAAAVNGVVSLWDISKILTDKNKAILNDGEIIFNPPEQLLYTNAKVLLVGESGAGKTGLSKRLAINNWEPSDSTVGAWATQWKLQVAVGNGVEREIWLWDFGGQADQRLIHQLFMDETSLAILVFDGQKEYLFDTLGQWDRDLSRASRKEFNKILVAGRVDAGSLRVSKSEIDQFITDRNYIAFIETSAKYNIGCKELKELVMKSINWDDIPCRTTEVLFKRLKDEILKLKDEGRVLFRFNELRETLQLRMPKGYDQFKDNELRAVLSLLAGPGVVWEFTFGSFVLLQPERINAYAQAVIRTLQDDEYKRGCLEEERVLRGDLSYESSLNRLPDEEERFILLAMHQTLIERGLCLRQTTDKGNILVFPSYYRRERQEQVTYPAVLSSYRFDGFLDEIYATLVVRLHHTLQFKHKYLWRFAADFSTLTNKLLGIKLNRLGAGKGELQVYFDKDISMEEKIVFCKYINEHLLQNAKNVERLRYYVCSCGTTVGNRELARDRLNSWLQLSSQHNKSNNENSSNADLPTIICANCEKRVPLWDDLEQCFASPQIQQLVREMQEESNVTLDNESKQRVLVGDVISTVSLAGQICREITIGDYGLDMEIEFKDDKHEPTGQKIYLQLKSGDSYIHERKKDGAELFKIQNLKHVKYWVELQFPVYLVVRNLEGEVRWMEISSVLKKQYNDGKKSIRQIVFKGERLDVLSIRRLREKMIFKDKNIGEIYSTLQLK